MRDIRTLVRDKVYNVDLPIHQTLNSEIQTIYEKINTERRKKKNSVFRQDEPSDEVTESIKKSKLLEYQLAQDKTTAIEGSLIFQK